MEIVAFAAVASIPVYFLWNALAPVYFYWLPQVYLNIPFWQTVGLLVLIAILRVIILPSSMVVNKPRWFVKK